MLAAETAVGQEFLAPQQEPLVVVLLVAVAAASLAFVAAGLTSLAYLVSQRQAFAVTAASIT